jgi:hypothetical protein
VTAPATKLPDAFLATIVEAVFKSVASVVNVIETFAESFAVKVPDPERCVPDAKVRIPLFTVGIAGNVTQFVPVAVEVRY